MFGLILGMFIWVPNFINPNSVKGEICRYYKKDVNRYVRKAGKFVFPGLFIVLSDSIEYAIFDKEAQEYLFSKKVIGKMVELKYQGVILHSEKRVTKLKIDGKIIIDQNKPLVLLYVFCVLWGVLGAMFEAVRIWKSV